MKRYASAVWNGTGKEGNGTLSTESDAFSNLPYTFRSRFEDEPKTNPEELVAAAHAGCFNMKLAFVLGAAGFTPTHLDTTCHITLEDGAISASALTLKATIEGIDQAAFETAVKEAKENCPISKLYNTTITVDATLN